MTREKEVNRVGPQFVVVLRVMAQEDLVAREITKSSEELCVYLPGDLLGGNSSEEDVLDLLREKKIAGAAFDVHGKEPLSADSPDLELENTELLPHIGGSTYNAIAKHSKMCFEAVRAFTENTKIDNRVV